MSTTQDSYRVLAMARWSIRRKLIIAIAAFLAVCILAMVSLRLMVAHRPRAYQPRPISAAEQEQIENQGLKKLEELFNQVHRLKPFVISLDKTMVNSLLMHEDVQRQVARLAESVDGGLGPPQVNLRGESIELMAEVEHKGVKTVMTVAFEPKIDDQGKLGLRLGSIRAGALSLPKSLLKRYLQQLAALLPADHPADKNESGGGKPQAERALIEHLRESLLSVLATLDGQEAAAVPAEFRVDKDRLAQITAVRVHEEAVEFDITPLVIDR